MATKKSIAEYEAKIKRDIHTYAREHPMGVLKVLAQIVENEAERQGYAEDPVVRNAVKLIRVAEEAFLPIYER
jgi:hypothetical protein